MASIFNFILFLALLLLSAPIPVLASPSLNTVTIEVSVRGEGFVCFVILPAVQPFCTNSEVQLVIPLGQQILIWVFPESEYTFAGIAIKDTSETRLQITETCFTITFNGSQSYSVQLTASFEHLTPIHERLG